MSYARASSSLSACCSGCAAGASVCSENLGDLTSGQVMAVGHVISVPIGYVVGRIVAGPKGGLVGAGLSLALSLLMSRNVK